MNILINTLQSLINFIFNLTGDFGISIVIITLIVKVAVLPFSIKQKISMKKQALLSKEIEVIKNKYKNNKNKIDKELTELYSKNSSSVLGMLTLFLQMPIISGLYITISRLPLEYTTILVPWCINIGNCDSSFIIPIIYCIISTLPSLLSYINSFNSDNTQKNILTLIPVVIFSFIITFKSPIGLGLYFITSGIYSLIEDIIFKLYSRNKTYSLNY